MIPFFPAPYPDELWYSVICRYHIRSGNPSIITATKAINQFKASNNFPTRECFAQ